MRSLRFPVAEACLGDEGQPALPDVKTASAALVTGRIVMAHMTYYVVDESRLDSLSSQNDEARAFFAVASAFLSLAVGFFTQKYFTDPLPDKAWLIVYVAAPICLVIAAVFGFLGLLRYLKGKSILKSIKANKATPTVPVRVDVNQ